jgi:sec-independent protein translocase protein TatC
MPPTESKEMPFLDHLEELRWRLIWSLAALAVGTAIAFAVVWNFGVIEFLQRPIEPYMNGRHLVYTHPGDSFSIFITTSLIFGMVLASPAVLYQLWAFLSPALYQHEKKVVIPVLVGAALLFASGVALAFYVVIPLTLSFLMTFQSASLDPMITASEYFGFVTTLALLFGAVFQLPIVILALTALGILNPALLARFRKHAFLGIWVISAVITPGDFLGTTVVLTASLYLLYEASIWLSMMVFRGRQRRAARHAAEEAAEAAADAADDDAPRSLLA